MPAHSLSVVLATHNEEANLDRCLRAVKSLASEIVIVDGQSSDKTVAIAKSYGAKVISTTNKPNFHINKNQSIDAAAGEWILQLDADEVVSPQLAVEITYIINHNSTFNGYWINRRNWFLTGFLSKGGQYPDPTLRLYRRGFGRLPGLGVHEQAEVTGSVGRLHSDLLHYRDTSFSKYLDGFNRYSSFLADQLTSSGLHFNILNTVKYLFIKPIYTFLNIFVRHRGYVDGYSGFVFALFSGFIHAVAYIKFWQHTYYPA